MDLAQGGIVEDAVLERASKPLPARLEVLVIVDSCRTYWPIPTNA